MSTELAKAIAVTSELCGRELSEGAARQFLRDLEGYQEAAVMRALDRCRRELQRPLTLAAVIERIDDGRPGPEEAWAMLPHDEATTVVWTTEMQQAWGIARELDDQIAARMAFREAYSRIVADARSKRTAPVWQPSLGHDPNGREPVLLEAVRLGRLTDRHVQGLLPYREPTTASELALVKAANALAISKRPAA